MFKLSERAVASLVIGIILLVVAACSIVYLVIRANEEMPDLSISPISNFVVPGESTTATVAVQCPEPHRHALSQRCTQWRERQLQPIFGGTAFRLNHGRDDLLDHITRPLRAYDNRHGCGWYRALDHLHPQSETARGRNGGSG